jgi:hypothetical protein
MPNNNSRDHVVHVFLFHFLVGSAAMYSSRSHPAVTRVYDDAGSVIATHEHKGDFKEW